MHSHTLLEVGEVQSSGESSVMERDAKGTGFDDASNAECGRPESPEGVIHGWEGRQAAREATSVCDGFAYNAGR